MTEKRTKPKKQGADAETSVEAYMSALDHPNKVDIQSVRKLLLAADKSITEGIKWNAPSFRTREWFATTNLRAKSGVEIILHFGAKKTAISETGVDIPDPMKLLKWLGKDRAIVKFLDARDIAEKRDALTALIRAWIKHVRRRSPAPKPRRAIESSASAALSSCPRLRRSPGARSPSSRIRMATNSCCRHASCNAFVKAHPKRPSVGHPLAYAGVHSAP